MTALIAADNTFGLAAVVAGLAAFGFWADTRPWGRRISGALVIILLAAAAANLGLIPHQAAMYDTVNGVFVPLAIPLLLFRADLRRVLRETGPVLWAFLVATVLTIIGAFAGAALLAVPEEARIAGMMAASYIGGSVNFVATAEATGLNDSTLYVAALGADVVGAVVYLSLLMLLPALPAVRRALPSKFISADGGGVVEDDTRADENRPAFEIVGASLAIAAAALICGISEAIVSTLGQPQHFVLVVTAGALLVANLAPRLVARFNADFELGTYLMYAFFAAIGAGANLPAVIGSAPSILAFILILVLTHLLLLIAVGRLLRLDLAEFMVASNACILGPASAAALAASKGWRSLITPGILVGILGYAIGTFCGVAVWKMLA